MTQQPHAGLVFADAAAFDLGDGLVTSHELAALGMEELIVSFAPAGTGLPMHNHAAAWQASNNPERKQK